MIREEFPKEYFLKIENDEFREGRITLNKLSQNYSVEIDIVQTESRKIWKHVDVIYNQTEMDEAIDAGVQRLANFLKGQG